MPRAQPLSRPLARARRGLSRLEPAPVRSPPRALERRRGARTRARRWAGRPPRRRPAACVGRVARGYLAKQNRYTTLQAEAMYARGERVPRPGSSCRRSRASCVSMSARRLSRRRRRARAHRDRLLQQLSQSTRSCARSSRPKRGRTLHEGAGHRRGRLHRHASGAAPAGATAPRSSRVDSFDPYYDVALKRARGGTARCSRRSLRGARSRRGGGDRGAFSRAGGFTHVAHLAAQPGVRYSLVNPAAYLRNNVDAFGTVLEGCRHARRRASGLCIELERLRREPHAAVFARTRTSIIR